MLELAGIIILGILGQWVAWRTKVPAILPLIIIGLFFGPLSTLLSDDGSKWIEPIFQQSRNKGLFPGNSLFNFVSLSISIILFEGGLTLKLKEISTIGKTISRIISLGAAITFFGGAIAAHYIMELNWNISFLFAGLIIVTGPTVIAPILRNVSLNKNVNTVLKWEGILIDPIGALVSVLVFDFIISGEGGHFTLHAIYAFLRIIFIGFSFGFTAAHALNFMIKKHLIPHYLLNVFVLALVLGVFVASDLFEHESGLLSVVVMGMVLGNLDVKGLKSILDFKESISVLLISILFILLSANINLEHLSLLWDYRVALLFLFVIFVLRPASIFFSTKGSTLSFNEKLFISWVGPRGIVAAGIASLFGLQLLQRQTEDAEFITPLVFMIVAGTVFINATTANWVAGILKVKLLQKEQILIIGANKAARIIAKILGQEGKSVTLVDRSIPLIEKARQEGINAIQSDIYEEDFLDQFIHSKISNVLGLTGNTAINQYAIDLFQGLTPKGSNFRLISSDELKGTKENLTTSGLFSCESDYLNLSEVVRDNPTVHRVTLPSKAFFIEVINNINLSQETIPLFIRRGEKLIFIPSLCDNMVIEKDDVLVYLGKKVDLS